ncbi:hypothetical protein CUR178_04093 [Leishmania enriettii]|uniref:Uncharacterized protein n=1 Tax=Leishmania enriettii TaxID=5663 RepID=A0A836HC37_LEIEN|nr:hypothetical protein CUR178_04093 [Leishmania enriettii]
MLSLLIDQCGADASDLPQLVRLNELIRAEGEEAGGGSSTTHSPPTTQAPPSPLAAPVTASVEVTRVAWQTAKFSAWPAPTPGEDHTMLGFLLTRCPRPEEQAQCTVLQQLHGLLLEETHEGSANEKADVSFVHHTTAPAHPAPSAVEDTIKPVQRQGHSVILGVIAAHDNWIDATTAVPSPALPHSLPSSPLSVPVPILPDAGDWKGTTTFFHAETVAASPLSAPPVTMPPVPAAAATGVAAAVTERSATTRGIDALRTHAPPLLPARTELRPKDNEQQSEGNRELATVLLSTHASLSEEPSASQSAHKVLAVGEGRRAESGAAAPLPPHYAPHLRPYGGRMPCAVNEALAARGSATAWLLAGGRATRPASATPSASRPKSGFARRFVAGLYERVSMTRAGALSSPILPHQRRHPQHLPQALAAGSGVGAARGHRACSDSSPLQGHLAGSWHGGQKVGAGRVSLTQERVSLLAQDVVTRPLFSTTAPLEYGHPNGAVGSGSLRPHRACPYHPGIGSPAVLPGLRPSRPASSLPRSGGTSAVEPLTSLMVVGTRIHLPSPHPVRRRYS